MLFCNRINAAVCEKIAGSGLSLQGRNDLILGVNLQECKNLITVYKFNRPQGQQHQLPALTNSNTIAW